MRPSNIGADLGTRDELRERLIEQGDPALTDEELLRVLWGHSASSVEPARFLLNRYGDLPTLWRAPLSEWVDHPSVGLRRACSLSAALELGRRAQMPRKRRFFVHGVAEVEAWYRPRLMHLAHEQFHVMCLDTRHRFLRDVQVAKGGLSQCPVAPREVFADALLVRSAAVVFVHNHPSGDSSPSDEDIQLTTHLKRASELLGIRALDHVIIGEEFGFSFVDAGLFERL